mgnify:CR=1 FL=1
MDLQVSAFKKRDCILDESIPPGLIDWVRCFLWHWEGSAVSPGAAAAVIVGVVKSSVLGGDEVAPYLSQDPVVRLKELERHWR